MQSSGAKPKQVNLSSFFNVKSKTAPEQQPSTSSTSTSAATSKQPKTRNLSLLAANKWKETTLAKYMANEWLVLNTADNSTVARLNCSVCKKYSEKIKGMKQFSHAWAFDGSTNLRLSNAQDHATGEPHKRALELYLKERGTSANERADKMSAFTSSGQQLVTTGIANMRASDLAETKVKFETAYYIAKDELPLSKYPGLLNLEERHGVTVGNAYRNIVSCSEFITSISDELENQLKKKLTTAKFYSVLSDGSTDVAITEKEAIFVQYLNTNPAGRDTVQVATSFLKLIDLKDGSAVGIVQSIKNSFQNIGIDDNSLQKKLIGFAADGASVNRGAREGVIGILQRTQPWIIYVWCVAHRLELSLKDALRNSCFQDVDEMLLRLYYLYENSPKKLRQLRELHSVYDETFEFEVGGVRPKRASGKIYFY